MTSERGQAEEAERYELDDHSRYNAPEMESTHGDQRLLWRRFLKRSGIASLAASPAMGALASQPVVAQDSIEDLLAQFQDLLEQTATIVDLFEDALVVDYRREQHAALREKITALELQGDIEQSLLAKVDAADKANTRAGEAAVAGEPTRTQNMHRTSESALKAFINEVSALKKDGTLNESAADDLSAMATAAREARGQVLSIFREVSSGTVTKAVVDRYHSLQDEIASTATELEGLDSVESVSVEIRNNKPVISVNPYFAVPLVIVGAVGASVVMSGVAVQLGEPCTRPQ